MLKNKSIWWQPLNRCESSPFSILIRGYVSQRHGTLEWNDVHLEPVNGARFGYVRIRRGKSKHARRNVPLTDRAKQMLENRKARSHSMLVFAEKGDAPMLVTSLDHLHAEVRKSLGMSNEFVLHSLRHTYGTRLGEGGADAFTIMRIMGHSSVTVSQRYVHPTPERKRAAIQKLENFTYDASVLALGRVRA